MAHAQVCGNSILEAGETCDDGNSASGDGCSTTCLIESNYECTLPVPPTQINGVASGGFEGGITTGDWQQVNFVRSQFCSTGSPGCGQGSGQRTGDWWARFGGTSATGEDASLEQALTIEVTDSVLSFWLEIPECDTASDFLSIKLDGNEVFRVDGSDSACGQSGYVQQVIDLATAAGGPYNDGSSHTLRFEVKTMAAGGPTTFLVDDVLIDRGISNPVPSQCTSFENCLLEDFDPGLGDLPAGWTVFEDVPTGPARNWGTTDDGTCGSGPATDGMPGNFTGGTGEAACADSDASGGQWSAYLCSEAVNLATASGSRLKFLYSYQFATALPGPEDIFRVLVGSETPSTGTIGAYNVLMDTSSQEQGTAFGTPGAEETIDLSAYQGQSLHICFHYGGDDDEYAQVDDVEVRADACDGGPPPEPPAAPPGNVSASDAVYTDKVRITWDDVPDETYYEVYRCASTDAGSCGSAIDPTQINVTSYDDTGADALGGVHYYRLKACNVVGCSGFSDADAGNRRYIPPPPANVAASDGTFTDKVRVTWNNVSGEDYFEVYRCSTTNTSSCGSAIASPSADVLSYDDTGASADGTVHYYRLKACSNANGCSALSAADAGFRGDVCGDGILGTSESCDDGNATGGDGCSASCQVESGYECTLPVDQTPSICTAYESCFLEGFDPASGGIPAPWTVFETAAQNYNWTTTDNAACTLDNLTGGSGQAACLDQENTGAPVDAYLCSDSIDLTAASNARLRFLLNYQVFSRSANDVLDVLVGTASPDASSVAAYNTIYAADGFNVGSYFAAPGEVIDADLAAFEGSAVHVCFHYRADDDWYAQVDDIEVRADTCDSGPPPEPPAAPPGNVSATDAVYVDKVRVTWNDVGDETSYEVYRCSTTNSNSCGSAIASPAINVTTYDDTGASADGTVHYYRLKACNVVGCSGFSDADAGNRRYIPPPPANVAASDGTFTDKVRVTWDNVTGEDFFEVYRCSTINTSSCGSAIASPSADVLSYDDTGASADGTVHYYRLKACSNANGCSDLSAADAGFRGDVCGDGILGTSESCDDGNAVDGDGCSAVCLVESGYECTLPVDQTPSVCTAYESCFLEDFDPAAGGLPGAWSTFNTAPQNHNWTTTDNAACTLDNLTGGSGEAACLDQENIGSLVDAYLCSEPIDLTNASDSRLRFLLNYQVFSRSADDILDVLVGSASPDATSVAGYSTVYATDGFDVGAYFAAPGEIIDADLAGFEGSAVHICFRYRADDDWYAQVDDVEVRADACDGGPPPAAPDNVSATDASFTDKVAVTWDDVTGEDFFEVYRCSTTNTSSCGSAIGSPAANATNFDDTGADADGTVHYYRLKACSNANGCSDFSAADAGNRDTAIAGCNYTLSQPMGGESWIAGSTYSINWISSGADCDANVELELYLAGSFVTTIATTVNDGSHDWNIPLEQAIGAAYTVKLVDAGNAADQAESMSPFAINDSFCNTQIVPPATESGVATFEACDLLIVPPGFRAASGSLVRLSSGRDIVIEPGGEIQLGASLETAVCGKSLCEVSAEPMPLSCHSCVELICEADSACCATGWTQSCVDRVATDCSLSCEQPN